MNKRILLEKYLENYDLSMLQIESFNKFGDLVLPKLIEEIKEIKIPVTLPNLDEMKIVFKRVFIEKPKIFDIFIGKDVPLYPLEARMRKLTYMGLVKVEAVFYIGNAIRDLDTVTIANLPIMVKSKYCNLEGLSKEELIKKGEDPEDKGGYFIINGNERIIIMQEDIASNRFFIEEKNGKIRGRYLHGQSVFRAPVEFEIENDGIITITSGIIKKAPITIMLKALGMKSDQEIFNVIKLDNELVFVNLYEFANITTEEEALLELAKYAGQNQLARDQRLKRMKEIVDKYFLPGIQDNYTKALTLAKLVRQLILYSIKKYYPEDKDHYANKRIKLVDSLLEDLFRVGLRLLVRDIIYNIQKYLRKEKLPKLSLLIREKVINQRLELGFNTGQWLNMTGISQTLQKANAFDIYSHKTRVVSNLDSSLRVVEARRLHGTHWGRFDPIETPEGETIGLRKQLSLFARISQEIEKKEEEKILKEIDKFVVNNKSNFKIGNKIIDLTMKE